jgi:hypothetical protein
MYISEEQVHTRQTWIILCNMHVYFPRHATFCCTYNLYTLLEYLEVIVILIMPIPP